MLIFAHIESQSVSIIIPDSALESAGKGGLHTPEASKTKHSVQRTGTPSKFRQTEFCSLLSMLRPAGARHNFWSILFAGQTDADRSAVLGVDP